MSYTYTAINNARQQGLTADQVEAMNCSDVSVLCGVDPENRPTDFWAHAVREVLINTLRSDEAEARRTAAQQAAETAAQAILPDATVEVQ